MSIYYEPEKYDLEKVAEYERSEADYSFDIRCVWKDKQGRLWTAQDSGCSCPSPLEDHGHGPDDHREKLDRLTSMTVLKDEYRQITKDGYNSRGWDEFKDKVAAALREAGCS